MGGVRWEGCDVSEKCEVRGVGCVRFGVHSVEYEVMGNIKRYGSGISLRRVTWM